MRLLKRKLADDKPTQLVEAGAVVVPDLPEAFPADVDVEHYVSMAEKLVKAITEPETRESHTIPLAKLSRAQRDQFEANKAGAAVPERCAALDLARYHADWANVVRGNPHDTMKQLLCRLWLAERGRLSHGDLVWVAGQLDEASGNARKEEWQRLADWIVRHVSPFPLPRTIPEQVARAMAWAVENVEPNKRRKAVKHPDVLRSDLVKADALARYEKTRDVYKLACSLCSICVKNAARLSEEAICGIIEEIDAYLARCPDQRCVKLCHPPAALDDPRCQALDRRGDVRSEDGAAARSIDRRCVSGECGATRALLVEVVDRIISQARPFLRAPMPDESSNDDQVEKLVRAIQEALGRPPPARRRTMGTR